MPVKFIETKPQQAPSSTGVRLVKNVGPERGPMVLYKVPKKISFNRLKKKVGNAIDGVGSKINKSIENAFTDNIEVWVARCYFSKPYSFRNSNNTIHTLKDEYLFGCVKLTRDTFWAFKNLTQEEPDAEFVEIDDFVSLDEKGRIKERNPNIKTRIGRVYFDKSEIAKNLPEVQSNQPYDYNTNRSFDLPNDTSRAHLFDLFRYYSTISLYDNE